MDINRNIDIFFSEIECPICKSKMVNQYSTTDIPYFGEIIIFTLICNNCGFKRTDLFSVYEKDPKRYIFKYNNEKDLRIRVIRSGSCTIKIPELGSIIEPGAESEGYITNIEGILNRINDILDMIEKQDQDEASLEKINEIRNKIFESIKGKFEFTLILEDPSGNSAIISDDESKLTIEDLKISEE